MVACCSYDRRMIRSTIYFLTGTSYCSSRSLSRGPKQRVLIYSSSINSTYNSSISVIILIDDFYVKRLCIICPLSLTMPPPILLLAGSWSTVRQASSKPDVHC